MPSPQNKTWQRRNRFVRGKRGKQLGFRRNETVSKTLCSEGRVMRVPDFFSDSRTIGDSYNSSLRSFETVSKLPILLPRHLPDPIAFGGVRARLFSLRPRHFAAVVGFVPADGVNHVATVRLRAIAQWFAVNHVIRDFFHES